MIPLMDGKRQGHQLPEVLSIVLLSRATLLLVRQNRLGVYGTPVTVLSSSVFQESSLAERTFLKMRIDPDKSVSWDRKNVPKPLGLTTC